MSNTWKIYLLALACFVLGSAATLALPGFGCLLGSRALLAVGAGVFCVTSMFFASKLATPGRQASALSTITMGLGTSLIFGVPLGRLVAPRPRGSIAFSSGMSS